MTASAIRSVVADEFEFASGLGTVQSTKYVAKGRGLQTARKNHGQPIEARRAAGQLFRRPRSKPCPPNRAIRYFLGILDKTNPAGINHPH